MVDDVGSKIILVHSQGIDRVCYIRVQSSLFATAAISRTIAET